VTLKSQRRGPDMSVVQYIENGWGDRLRYNGVPIGIAPGYQVITFLMTSHDPIAGVPGHWLPGGGVSYGALFLAICLRLMLTYQSSFKTLQALLCESGV